jgi:hypothetical protein
LALTVTLVTELVGFTDAEAEPLVESAIARPPLAAESVLILPVSVDMVSASRVMRAVAENAGSTDPDTNAATARTSALAKREARFMMTSQMSDDRLRPRGPRARP